MIFAVEKSLVFTKCWCFREHVRRYLLIFLFLIFLIMLSITMYADVLVFWGLVGFISFFIWGSIFLIHHMAHLFTFEDVTSVLVKCVLYSGCAWITLSIFVSFTLFFCFGNFVNWLSLPDWIGFEALDIQAWRRSSFCSEMSSFGLSHGLLLLHSQKFRLSSVLMTLFFFFYILP